MKVIGMIEIEIMEDENDTKETVIEEAKKEFNYAVQDKEMYAGRLKWSIAQ